MGATERQLNGQRAEALARTHLQDHGLKFVCANFRTPFGELDLVMRDGENLVFVEVRYRRSAAFGGAGASVDRRKQLRLCRSAQYYLRGAGADAQAPCRFDVVAISGNLERASIDWLTGAFEAV